MTEVEQSAISTLLLLTLSYPNFVVTPMFYIPKMMFKNIKVQKLPYQGKRKKHEKYTQFN